MDFGGNEVNTLIIYDQLLTTELPDGQPQRATIIKPITTYESNSYQEGNDYNKGGEPASSKWPRIYIHKAEYKGIRMRRARDTTQSRFQRYAYIALA